MARRFSLFAAVLAALLLVGCGETPAGHFARARQEFAGHDFNAARLDLIAALKAEPTNQAMLDLLAQTLLRMGDADGARVAIGRLAAARAPSAGIARLQAELALLTGHPQDVAGLLGQDGDPAAWRLRGLAHVRLNQLPQAQAAFEQGMAAGTDPRLAADYAEFRLAQRDIDSARRIHALLLQQLPQGFETLMIEGRIALAQADGNAAFDAFRRAATRYPARFEPFLAQAEVLEGMGQYDKALKLLEQAGERAPGDDRLDAMELRLLSAKGDWRKVREILQPREGELSPTSTEGLTYAEAELRLGFAEQARMHFTRALLMAPRNPYARRMLAEAQLATDDPASAWRTIAPLAADALAPPEVLELAVKAARLSAHPDAASLKARLDSRDYRERSALLAAGNQAFQRGDWDAAIALYRNLLGYGPHDTVLRQLAIACSRSGKHAEAVAFADQALALGQPHAEEHHLAGWVRLRAGSDSEGALRLLRLAVEAEPDNAEYVSDFAIAEAAAG